MEGGAATHIAAVAKAVQQAKGVVLVVGHSNTVPAIIKALGGPTLPDICDANYSYFFVLTPARYRKRGCHKWPGALLITLWWLATVELLPLALSFVGGYNLTYGSLAGVMISLIFFFIVGLGVVIGAELNAALAESGATALKGEIYTGPYTDELPVEEPQPGEDVEPVPQKEGPQL